jgi:hypothetical protein
MGPAMAEREEIESERRPEPEQPGRYQRSTSGMVGALLVTLLVILAFVGFRALNRSNLDVKPERVDYLAQVRYAQQAGSDVVYPARLPSGWYATQVTLSPGTPSELELSMLTGDGAYVGFVESPESLPDLLSTYVDPHATGGQPTTVTGSVVARWSTWTDGGGDTALAAQRGQGKNRQSLLVFGTVTQAQLEDLASSLTTSPAAD